MASTKIAVKPRPAPKAAKSAAPAKPAKAAAPAKPAKAPKPSVSNYNFQSGYTGASDVLTTRPSRQMIDFSAFGSLKDAALTDRDQKAIDSLRKNFGERTFERGNLDTGILKRLGQRGVIEHVAGRGNDPKATFKLTPKGLGKVPTRRGKVGHAAA